MLMKYYHNVKNYINNYPVINIVINNTFRNMQEIA